MALRRTRIPTLLAAAENWHLSFVIIFGPVIIVVASLMLIFVQDSIMRGGRYIKVRIEPHFLGTAGGWENFLEEKHNSRRRVERHVRASVIIAFAFYYLAATFLVYAELKKYSYTWALVFTTMYLLALVGAFNFIYRNFPRGTDSAVDGKT